ncbi:Hsp70 family protein [Leucothrix sargassi]|nr:Hsp70 family protein [Leucothrix sargassi]
MSFCGLDFGTSNSTIGIHKNNELQMVLLDDDKTYLRSAIFLNAEDREIVFGTQAIEDYIEGIDGRLMTSLKSVLGSSLMNEKTNIFNEMKPFSDILGFFIKNMKQQAERVQGGEIDSVVLGRPVRFNDDDDAADQLAEDTLRQIAEKEGFKHIDFQFEPIAAALSYAQSVTSEELALIVDIGGGTSDFTLIKITPESGKQPHTDILASSGVHIGGTDFDRLLNYNHVMPSFGLHTTVRTMNGNNIEIPTSYYRNLSTWHKINDMYGKEAMIDMNRFLATANDKEKTRRLKTLLEKREGHHLLQMVENGKKYLSDELQTTLALDFIEQDLSVELIKSDFEQSISEDLKKINTVIAQLLKDTGVAANQVDAVFFTGGTTRIKKLQDTVMSEFTGARIVNGDVFNSVAMGLSIDALNKFA